MLYQQNRQMIGLGLMFAVMASMTIYVVRTRIAATHKPASAIAQIAQQPTAIASPLPPQLPEDCKTHEVFRVSDRRCYVLQGE
jgi:hypothetical protein